MMIRPSSFVNPRDAYFTCQNSQILDLWNRYALLYWKRIVVDAGIGI